MRAHRRLLSYRSGAVEPWSFARAELRHSVLPPLQCVPHLSWGYCVSAACQPPLSPRVWLSSSAARSRSRAPPCKTTSPPTAAKPYPYRIRNRTGTFVTPLATHHSSVPHVTTTPAASRLQVARPLVASLHSYSTRSMAPASARARDVYTRVTVGGGKRGCHEHLRSAASPAIRGVTNSRKDTHITYVTTSRTKRCSRAGCSREPTMGILQQQQRRAHPAVHFRGLPVRRPARYGG